MPQNNTKLALSLIIFVALFRLIPHPPNFTPVLATGLFGGAIFANRWTGFLVPLLAMFVSDAVIGFHSGMLFVYPAIFLCTYLGQWLRNQRGVFRVGTLGLLSAVLFFLISNFGVWASGKYYPLNAAGLWACYVAAIPFIHNTVLSTWTYSLILFGSLALTQRSRSTLAVQRSEVK